MEKVLYVAPYRQVDDWGVKSLNLLNSLSEVENIDLYSRPIYYSMGTVNNCFVMSERPSIQKYDTVIQYSVPHTYRYFGQFNKNIFVFEPHTLGRYRNNWLRVLGLADEIWTTSSLGLDFLRKHFSEEKVKNVGFSIGEEKEFEKEEIKIDQNLFTYYTVCENESQAESILIAFYKTFYRNPNVALVLIVANQQVITNAIERTLSICGFKKEDTGLPRLHVISADGVSQSIWNELHTKCDCLLELSERVDSKVEATRSAVLFGNPVIALSGSILGSTINSLKCESYEDIIRDIKTHSPDLFTSDELCYKFSPHNLAKELRVAFEDMPLRNKIKRDNLGTAETFSHKGQAQTLEKILCPMQ